MFEQVVVFWLVLSVILMGVEVLGLTGMGAFFGGFSALLIGAAVYYDLVGADQLVLQAAVFLAMTAGSIFLFWKTVWGAPEGELGSYHHLIGDRATVWSGGLKKGQTGNVRWSGTTMLARIHDDAKKVEFSSGEEVSIIEIHGNILIVK